MTAPVEVSAETARRFILGRQGLWPARRWTGKDGARAAMRAIEHLQLDPLAIVARSHHLKLHARVLGYQERFFDELVYRDREFFDWGGWLAVRPMDELPYWRVLMRRNAHHGGVRKTGEEQPEAIQEMRARLRAGERLSSRDLGAAHPDASKTYRGSKAGALALYYLWRTGEAMTFERRGFERVYAASEAVAPAELLREAPEREAELFLVRKAVAHEGIGRIPSMSLLFARTVSRAEHLALESELVDRGEIVPLAVEGWRGRQFALAEEVPLLEAVARGEAPAAWRTDIPGPVCALLSPLDPLVARGRSATLFGFEHTWEIYKRAEDVRFGRFTMPILFADSLIGRIDLKSQRPAGRLTINGLWFEAGVVPGGEMLAAIHLELVRLARLIGARTIDGSALTDGRLAALLEALPDDAEPPSAR